MDYLTHWYRHPVTAHPTRQGKPAQKEMHILSLWDTRRHK